jgi:hypothetical protein
MKTMKTRLSSVVFVVVLSGLAPFAANACGTHINLAAIEHRMADPNLPVDLKERAVALKARAASAIEAGKRDEGRRMYYRLMDLLGVTPPPGPFRCG